MSNIVPDWQYMAYYGGDVAWAGKGDKATLYRLTKIHNRKWLIEHGGNFFRQWTELGEASSKEEAEAMVFIHASDETAPESV